MKDWHIAACFGLAAAMALVTLGLIHEGVRGAAIMGAWGTGASVFAGVIATLNR